MAEQAAGEIETAVTKLQLMLNEFVEKVHVWETLRSSKSADGVAISCTMTLTSNTGQAYRDMVVDMRPFLAELPEADRWRMFLKPIAAGFAVELAGLLQDINVYWGEIEDRFVVAVGDTDGV